MLLAALTASCGGSRDLVFTSPVIPTPPPTYPATVDLTNILPTPLPTPTAVPTPEPVVIAQSSGSTRELRTAPQSCYDNPDRFNWQVYALLVGFPESSMDELRKIVKAESNGDLCAINQSSGATCWIQQLPGGDQFHDPLTCMSIGYAKWLDGGRNFYRHWYQWWTK